jgi:hypothetical protein
MEDGVVNVRGFDAGKNLFRFFESPLLDRIARLAEHQVRIGLRQRLEDDGAVLCG